MRYSPIVAPLKETGLKGRERKLHNISTFRCLYWCLVLDVGLTDSVVLLNNSS